VNFLKAQGYEALVSDGESDEINIPLKGAAVKAGLGWIGKNSLLINKRYGSFQALGAIITDADIGEDNREAEKCCGKCTKCIDSCPTNAIKAPYMLDRPNCLSDFFEDDDLDRVIEIRDAGDAGDTGTHPKDGGMSPSLPSLPRLGGYFFECDICQNACPWNQKHIAKPLETPHGKLFDSNKLNPIFELKHLKEMNEDTYKKEIAPLIIGHKLPYETFKRNISTLATL
jgi:epoxyqueuosine reductase